MPNHTINLPDHVKGDPSLTEAAAGAGGIYGFQAPATEDEVSQSIGLDEPHSHGGGGQTSASGGHDNRSRYYALVWVKYCRQDSE